jgi:lipopolysaccharide export system protein LptA
MKAENKSIVFAAKIFLSSFLFCICLTSYAQQKRTIQLVHANSGEYDKRLGDGAQRLIGNVELADDSTALFSDSAYSFPDNSFRAFGHVHMTRKDTMDLYGDSLHYNGTTRITEVYGKIIKCVRKGMTLTTKHLMYDLKAHAINYWDGGTIVDTANTLTSVLGIYNTAQKMCYFKEKVVLTNPKYVIHCDTMLYSPDDRTAHFIGPTRITSKSNFMYCEKGYYNTKNNFCQFWQKPYILNKKGDSLSGEQIYYDRNRDFGQILDHVSLVDTTDNIILNSDYAEYDGTNETMLATCKALLLQVYNKDTLHLHGDTLFAENISMSDTNKSGKPKLMLAYHHVKFFKKDLQGKCDSLTYDEKDSIMRMYYNPILWSDVNQLTADTMKLHMRNKKMDVLDMRGHSFICSKDTLASKLLEADSATNDYSATDTLAKKSPAKDSIIHSGHDSLSNDTLHLHHDSLTKDTSHLHHDSLSVDSSKTVRDSIHPHKIFHGSDTLQFNQIKGKNMRGYFRDNKIYKIKVMGNAQTIYYVYTDNNTSILGINRADCSNMIIFIVNNKINSLTFLQKPDATLFPMKDVKPADFLLGGFKWYERQRPRTIEDIFRGSE